MLDEFAQRDRQQSYWNIVTQTAQFRFKISWEGARELMAERGFSASQVILCSCDHGNDVCAGLVLSNGVYVRCDFLEDPQTRRKTSITSWRELPLGTGGDGEYLGAEIFATPDLKDAFDRAVQAFYDFHLKQNDRPLPPVPPRKKLR